MSVAASNTPGSQQSPVWSPARIVLLFAFLGWMFAGVEMSLMVSVTRPAIHEFLATTTGLAGAASLEVLSDEWYSRFLVAFFLGAAAGGGFLGWMGDRFGRSRAMALSILAYSVLTGVSYFARSADQLLILRFLACMGVGGMWPNGVALVTEVWPAVSRPMLAGLIGAAANVGFLILGAMMLAFPIQNDAWRWVLVFGGTPCVLGIAAWFCVPESPLWLAGRKAGPAAQTPLTAVFRPPLLRATLLGIALGTVPLIGGWASGQRLIPWAAQVGEARHLPHLKAITQIIQSIGAVAGSLAGGWLAARWGARRSYFWISALSLGLSLALFRLTRPGEPAFYILSLALGLVAISYFGWLPYYLPGLFPTGVRATGAGVAFNAGRIVSAAALLLTASLSRWSEGDVGRMGFATCWIYALGLLLAALIPRESSPGNPR